MIASLIAQNAEQFEEIIKAHLQTQPQISNKLYKATSYGCLDGGKRFRPFLTKQVTQLFDKDEDMALKISLPIELIHCYSLIHDDLPAMDDDDLRRGKATLHKQYDEATAILVGDGLQSLAFEYLSSPNLLLSAELKIKLIGALSHAAGFNGMVLGQMLDIEAESAENLNIKNVENIQRFKTGALIACSAQFGAIIGEASEAQEQKIYEWASYLGEAFQITDDLLDHLGDSDKMGKRLQKDDEKGKVTFVTLLGVDGAGKRLKSLKSKAFLCLAEWGEKAETLNELWDWLIQRDH